MRGDAVELRVECRTNNRKVACSTLTQAQLAYFSRWKSSKIISATLNMFENTRELQWASEMILGKFLWTEIKSFQTCVDEQNYVKSSEALREILQDYGLLSVTRSIG